MGEEGFESYASVGNIRKCKLSYIKHLIIQK